MYNLLNFYQVIQFIKNKISPSMYRQKNDHIMIHCPFCGDSTRKNAHHHGHMYISITSPVFHCHRCSASGTIIGLLVENDFNNIEIINDLKRFIKYKFSKNYFDRVKKEKTIDIIGLQNHFKKNNPIHYKNFIDYIRSRIGNIQDISQFLLVPQIIFNDLNIAFYNKENKLVCWRNINPQNQFRYKMNGGNYYFQKKLFDQYNQIVICEGPFDILNLYLYNNRFKDAFFLSLNSTRYISDIEQLIIQELFIGNYEINIVFDNTIKYDPIIYKHKYLLNYNNDIKFKYWIPNISKDTGEYPIIKEITC